MATSVAPTGYVRGLIALLFWHGDDDIVAPAEATMKGTDYVRVVTDQMHQLEIVKVETHAFRVQRSAIGQIAFNDDASTMILSPFSGRVVRLIAKVGDLVKSGDPLLEIDSPDQVSPQNDFIAAQTARNKAKSLLGLTILPASRSSRVCSDCLQGCECFDPQYLKAKGEFARYQ
jgi:membrane fusion protein, heavy metal efflux system